jgi:hypothetical protein
MARWERVFGTINGLPDKRLFMPHLLQSEPQGGDLDVALSTADPHFFFKNLISLKI